MITFGLPKKGKEKKEEPYADTPVLTLVKVADKGFNRRFILNTKALESMGVTPGLHRVLFAFEEDGGRIFIGKNDSEDSLVVGKNCAFSNKKYYEHIVKHFELDSTVDNYLELKDINIDIAGISIFELTVLSPSTVETTTDPVISISEEEIMEEGVTEDYIPTEDELSEFVEEEGEEELKDNFVHNDY